MEFVVETLQKVFRYDLDKAINLMLQVHHTGQAVVWSGAKEHAEFKADQIISRGPDPMMKHKGAGTLRVTIEPLPA
jgi:ATP-dependent Clp protease adapter protein ClpS